MGKGGVAHESVVEYLVKEYGTPDKQKCHLKGVYPTDWETKYIKEGKLCCGDYVGDHPQCNAIVDVIGSEGWMETLGKVIPYSNEIIKVYPDKEVWLVFYSVSEWDYRKKKFKNDQKKFLDYRRDLIRILLNICKNVLKPDVAIKLKFYDFDGEGLIPIN